MSVLRIRRCKQYTRALSSSPGLLGNWGLDQGGPRVAAVVGLGHVRGRSTPVRGHSTPVRSRSTHVHGHSTQVRGRSTPFGRACCLCR